MVEISSNFSVLFFLEYEPFITLYESILCLNGFQSSLASRSDFISLCMYLIWLY